MRRIGAIQDAVRRAFLDHVSERASAEVHNANPSHDLICARCNTVYDQCDEPQCSHPSMPAGLCQRCGLAGRDEGASTKTYRQSA